MITILILLARFIGLLQSALGRGQTHLLTAAQNLGWQPESDLARHVLERRQAGLVARAVTIRLRKGQKRAARRTGPRKSGGNGNGTLLTLPLLLSAFPDSHAFPDSVALSTPNDLAEVLFALLFLVFLAGFLLGLALGARHSRRRWQTRSQRPVTTLYNVNHQPHKYD